MQIRRCPLCKKASRGNDPWGSCQVQPGNVQGAPPGCYGACSYCCAIHEPDSIYAQIARDLDTPFDPLNVPQSYPRDLGMNPNGMNQAAPAWYCGVCRLYAREDSRMEGMRLFPSDFSIDDPLAPILFPQTECVNHHEGWCSRPGCGWVGRFEDYCPRCWNADKSLPVNDLRLTTHRRCEWHGEWKPQCPSCGAATRRREAMYYACDECREKYKQVVFDRLVLTKAIPEHMIREGCDAVMRIPNMFG